MAELRELVLSSRRVLPTALLELRFSRSGGPGGQNVNKLSTKVDLRLDLDGAVARALLGMEEVVRIREKLANRLDSEGRLLVVSSEHRTQAANLEAALCRMEALLVGALAQARPRRPTRPTRASRERRLEGKQHRGDVKQGRRRIAED